MTNDTLLTVRDVMERLAVSERTIRYWIAERGMPHILLDAKTLRIPAQELDLWIRRNEDRRSQAARGRLLAWALQNCPDLVAITTEKPMTVFYWALGQLPRLPVAGQRIPFTPEALKQLAGVSAETLILGIEDEQTPRSTPGSPSAYRSGSTLKAS